VNPDLASLANLRDIAEPPPVPWWPPAPGWWWLMTIVGLIVVVAAVQAWRRWSANAYRRAALRELRGSKNVASIAELLKRTALVAYPRARVASLTGVAWIQWLAETGGQPVPAGVIQALTVGSYTGREFGDVSELAAFAAEWIRDHKMPKQDADLC